MNGVADGHNVAWPAHIQVRSSEGDEAGVSHCMLVPTQHAARLERYFLTGTIAMFPGSRGDVMPLQIFLPVKTQFVCDLNWLWNFTIHGNTF